MLYAILGRQRKGNGQNEEQNINFENVKKNRTT
jgi:hypothetical protein